MTTITLTTDFGDSSSYIAAMKGAILTVNPAARLLDLSHQLPKQDLVAAAYFLIDSVPWFPAGAIHVVVVDPGVGTDRALLCVEWSGQTILVPDNGCWTPLLASRDRPRVTRLENRQFWRPHVSATFHGRDILAPVAGHLSLGAPTIDLGPRVDEWVQLALPRPMVTDAGVRGEIVVVDSFGNLMSNVGRELVPAGSRVRIGGLVISKLVKTYGEAEPGTLVALIASSGRLEVAVVNGSAAARLALARGAAIEVIGPV
jgi:S-adenosyl-L-methionine hydrolase (adenosine-forming)